MIMLETAFTHRLVTPTAITRAARGARLALVFALLMAMLIFPPPRVVHAATITVTKLADENDHSCTDGDCSLRDAIETAAPNDTITFGVTGTIILTLGQLEINKHLTISGPGAAKLTISGDNASRVFHIASGNVTISGVTITKGYDAGVDGAGIYNEGTLTVSNCIFSGNLADDDGAAIRSEGALTVRGSTFSGNQAGNDGGSISFFSGDSRLTVTDSTFSGNTAGNNGGGISAVWASSLR
jgi:CSLREA domain-containing protein